MLQVILALLSAVLVVAYIFYNADEETEATSAIELPGNNGSELENEWTNAA